MKKAQVSAPLTYAYNLFLYHKNPYYVTLQCYIRKDITYKFKMIRVYIAITLLLLLLTVSQVSATAPFGL